MDSVRTQALEVRDRFSVNTIIWLRSLPDDELGPSRRMTEDLSALSVSGAFAFDERPIGSRAELLAELAMIASSCASGLRPVLHFDCHGTAEGGLLLAPSGELVGWADLANALRAINVAAQNNVCCIFGACFGLHLSTELSLSLPSPYFLTIAPEKEIAVGVLEARTAPFYARLYETGNITQAYEEVLAPDLAIFYCKGLFAKALATYFVDHATGAAGRRRREQVISRSLGSAAGDTSGQALRVTRSRIKHALRPSQELIDYFANRFLIGREPGFGFDEISRLAAGIRRRRETLRLRLQRAEKGRSTRR